MRFHMLKILAAAVSFVVAVSAAEISHACPRFATCSASAIVSVQNKGMESGTGVVVSRDGLILTAASLLSTDGAPITIRFCSGRSVSADIVARDSATESALLRIKDSTDYNLPFLRLVDSSRVKVGSRAMTAGNPLDALSSDHQVAFSTGTITRIAHVCSADACSRYDGPALETDAAINAGSEGGALLNDEGELIGMTCLCVDRTRMRGCAVPSNRIKTAYEKYLTGQQTITELTATARCGCRTDLTIGPLTVGLKSDASFVAPKRAAVIQPGTRIQIVTNSAAASQCICNGIISATCRCDGSAVQIDARLNESDMGAKVLNQRGELIGTVSNMNLMCRLGAQNTGVSFFTPIEKQPKSNVSNDPLVDLVAASTPAFVFIGEGSGVCISDDGLVLTNYHVAGSQSVWAVRLGSEQRTRLCDLLGTDLVRDVCLLKIRDIDHAPHLKLGSSASLKPGEQVLALGDPFKLGDKAGDPAASMGIISALHRNQGRYVDAIQTDCAINPGNSGGPLINMAGELIGLNGQIISRYGKYNTGIAFAIPVDQIKCLLPTFSGGKSGGGIESVLADTSAKNVSFKGSRGR